MRSIWVCAWSVHVWLATCVLWVSSRWVGGTGSGMPHARPGSHSVYSINLNLELANVNRHLFNLPHCFAVLIHLTAAELLVCGGMIFQRSTALSLSGWGGALTLSSTRTRHTHSHPLSNTRMLEGEFNHYMAEKSKDFVKTDKTATNAHDSL